MVKHKKSEVSTNEKTKKVEEMSMDSFEEEEKSGCENEYESDYEYIASDDEMETKDSTLATAAPAAGSQQISLALDPICHLSCGHENHQPVTCQTLASWLEAVDTYLLGILTVPPALIQIAMTKRIHQVATAMCLPPSGMVIILREKNWAVTEILATIDVPELVRRSGASARCHRFIGSNRPTTNGPNGAGGEGRKCGICLDVFLDDDAMFHMPCGHDFCRDCWANLIDVMLREGSDNGAAAWRDFNAVLGTTCPDPNCTEVISEDEIAEIAPRLLSAYRRLLLYSFVVAGEEERVRWCPGPDIRWCPGPNCDRVAALARDGLFDHSNRATVLARDTLFDGRCVGCSTAFCFRCGEAPHAPRVPSATWMKCRANQVDEGAGGRGGREEFFDGGGGENPKPPTALTKKCPNCNVEIEKNGGCNHMTCTQCRHEFCWICLGEYRQAHFCGREGKIPGGLDRPEAEERRRRELTQRVQWIREAKERRQIIPPFNLDYIYESLQEIEAPLEEEQLRTDLDTFNRKKEQMDRFSHYYNRFAAHSQGQDYAESQIPCVEGRVNEYSKVSDFKSGTDCDCFYAANRTLVASRRVLKYSYCYAYYSADGDNKELFQDHQELLERFIEELSILSEVMDNDTSYKKEVVNLTSIVNHYMEAVLNFDEVIAFAMQK